VTSVSQIITMFSVCVGKIGLRTCAGLYEMRENSQSSAPKKN